MMAPVRSKLCCAAAALALAAAPAAGARASTGMPSPQALYLPAALSNICEADQQALQQAILRHWQPSLKAIDQWTQLVRSFSCDLSGSKDLGWHRVQLRAYESAIRYPLTWLDSEVRNGHVRKRLRTYYSAAQLPPRIDFWVGGQIDEIRYDRRAQRLDARFPATPGRGTGGPPGQCATTLQFRQQNGLWLLSGVEPNTGPHC
ncbi:hypothetical protein BKK79_07945 [Cupriavidus sp. USMAA2-4]|uniref:Uncharacterized protein n=1 Tax=Cupriavidus malaysiensis TaxID=367825 RepID=A0ABN4TM46_9BURK|nr:MULTISPECIES: hypothetical protein [Cupriavidus]AOY91738.1 hypothetical protein BKK79_07945 [Cupriavidus sp. USMAA2-4]AOZ05134.1 hypothetical protein BKK80_04320 [Cupriavidus malaysiensis]